GDTQLAAILVAEFLGDAADGLGLLENVAGNAQDHLPGRGDMGQVLAAAGEHFNAKFVLEHADLLADAGLRGIQRLRGGGDIEIVAGHFPDVAELLELHGTSLTSGPTAWL